MRKKVTKVFKFQEICEESIVFYYMKLKDKTSVGWDGLSTHVLKKVITAITVPLTHVFNLSLKTGYMPQEFKISRVIPLFKDGDKGEFGNYRPISLIPTFSKLFEQILNDQIRNYFNCFDLFTGAQFGFRKGSSPDLAVAKLMNKILENQDDISLGIFIDARKAFDMVSHDILLTKLKHYGFRGIELELMKNYLKGREQYTEVSGEVSVYLEILAGVPQGSILGFILMIYRTHLSSLLFCLRMIRVYYYMIEILKICKLEPEWS